LKHDHWKRPVRAYLHTAARYLYDARRYLKYSGAVRPPAGRTEQHSYLMKLAHVIEKGLALPQTRLNFGEATVQQACELLLKDSTSRSTAHVMALNAIRSYVRFHEDRGAEPLAICREVLARFGTADVPSVDSLYAMSRQDIVDAGGEAAIRFMRSRRSIRQFADRPVDRDKIRRAVMTAQMAPSVCNRQSGRVHVIYDRELMQKALSFQGGNRGFGDTFGALAIVTSDLGSFLEPNERGQAYVDGGLFAMMLMLGLHAQALGSCPLNWSRNPLTDLQFRRAIPIPEAETVIMMIGIGELRDEFVVANSARLPIEEVLNVIDTGK